MGKHRHHSQQRSRSREHKRHKHRQSKRQRQHKPDRQRQTDRAHRHKNDNNHRTKRSESPEERGKYYVQKVDPSTIVKQLPSWEPSGILLEFYNNREGVAMKFHEPPEAKIPVDKWRIYPFKDGQSLNPILMHDRSCFLIGKDVRVCDILLQHSTVSRQHAVIQFREIKSLTVQGYTQQIRPYVMDLESSNGTFLNGSKLQASRYVQLLPEDKITFGSSKQEFLIVLE